MADLSELKREADKKRAEFYQAISREFPGLDRWHWFRACEAIAGRPGRRNDDTTHDAALASSVAIRAAWDSYIAALHVFYIARDGEKGFLGSRGL